jgi:hypothetical protein
MVRSDLYVKEQNSSAAYVLRVHPVVKFPNLIAEHISSAPEDFTVRVPAVSKCQRTNIHAGVNSKTNGILIIYNDI